VISNGASCGDASSILPRSKINNEDFT